MALPFIKTDNQQVDQIQTKWRSELNPLLAKPINNSNQLTGVIIQIGVNTINHLLDRVQQGWYITDINASAILFRSQPFNDKTLTLTSNAACVVNLQVF